MLSLARFAGADYQSVPARLRKPFSPTNWRALAEDLRLRNIRERLTEQVAAEHQAKNEKREARRAAALKAAPPVAEEAPAPVVEDTPAPAPTNPSRYVVACVAGCGTLHPASSGRPVVVTCGGRGQTKPRGKRSMFGGDEGPEATARLIARLRQETAAACEETNAPKRKAKAPKYRRRAVCANAH